MLNIAVLVSGGGTNLQALIDAQNSGGINNGRISLVLSSNKDAYALKRAESAGIKTAVIRRADYKTAAEYDAAIIGKLAENKTDLVVLAGFMQILGTDVIRKYNRKIINVHPALIPAFCGPGFYGLKVHRAALDYGVKVTGATVHFVNEVVDGGEIILQKAVDVLSGDTPEILQKRVMEEAEWQLLPKAVSLFCEGKI